MPSTVVVNYLTTQHKVSTGFTMAFPDVCKTPAPPAPSPVPIPYPNMGNTVMASKGVSKRVKNNRQKVMVKGAKYTMTNGDNAGIAGGVISGKFMGTDAIKNQSFNTKYEKKGVGRLSDPHGVNGGSTVNTMAPAEGQPPNSKLALSTRQRACDQLTKDKYEREKGTKPNPNPPPDTLKTNEIKMSPKPEYPNKIGNPVDVDDLSDIARRHGMPPDHAHKMRAYAENSGYSFSLREGNPACERRMTSGFEGKPMSCTGDSISSSGNLPGDCKGLVGEQNKDGSWAGIYTSDRLGEGKSETGKHLWTAEEMRKTYDGFPEESRAADWENELRRRGAYTGDYDMHDMFYPNYGQSLHQGALEEEINKGLNEIMGVQDRPLCQHGPQNNFGVYCDENPCTALDKRLEWGDKKFKRVCRPDTFADPVRPLLHFDRNGKVYVLDTPEDMKNLHDCKGADWPDHWPTPEQLANEHPNGDGSFVDDYPDSLEQKARDKLASLKAKDKTDKVNEKITKCEDVLARIITPGFKD